MDICMKEFDAIKWQLSQLTQCHFDDSLYAHIIIFIGHYCAGGIK